MSSTNPFSDSGGASEGVPRARSNSNALNSRNINNTITNRNGMMDSCDVEFTGEETMMDYMPNSNQSAMAAMNAGVMGNGGFHAMNAGAGGLVGGSNHSTGSGGLASEDTARLMNMSGHHSMGNMGMDRSGQGFAGDMDMMNLFRTKEKINMMNAPRGSGSLSVQDKMRAFTQEQYAKGQGLPMSFMGQGSGMGGMIDPMGSSFHGGMGMDSGMPVSSFLEGSGVMSAAAAARVMNLKCSAAENSTINEGKRKSSLPKEAEYEPESSNKGKRRKKGKKANDMPRRALSAYNIFFSQQRELILKEIDSKPTSEKDAKREGEDEKDEEVEDVTNKNDEAEKSEAPSPSTDSQKKDDNNFAKGTEKESSAVPTVMNRTFFPTRAKRAHRKVHGKIGLVELAREVSKRWKELDPVTRKHYQELAEEDRKKHKEIMAEYQERKAAENMVSMGGRDEDGQAVLHGGMQMGIMGGPDGMMGGLGGGGGMNMAMSEQDMRENMAHQYQQRILAEMMAERRSAQQRMNLNMMNRFGPGPGGVGGSMNASMNTAMMQSMNGGMNDSSHGGGGGGSHEMNAMLEYQRLRMRMMSGMSMGNGAMGGMGP